MAEETISGIDSLYLQSFYELGGTKAPQQLGSLLRLEIGERAKQINAISGITPGEVETLINTVSGTLETRIDALEQEITRLQTELNLHEHNGLHWTEQQIDQRAQSLIDASSSN